MWIQRSFTLLVILTVLWSTVGLVVHDHGVEIERGLGAGYDCVVDHDKHQGLAKSSRNELHESGALHRHQCVACPFSSQRTLFASYRDFEGEIDAQRQRILRPSAAPRVLELSYTYTLRGPPTV